MGTELRLFLAGEMLDAFDALRIPGEHYDVLRTKLVDWLKSSQDKLEHDAKKRFGEARKEAGERVRLYAARLEKLFSLAYPRRTTDSSRAIKDKFLDTVPLRFRDQILTAQAIGQATSGSELSWNQVMTMASQYDARDFSRGRPTRFNAEEAEHGEGRVHCCSCEPKTGLVNVVSRENHYRDHRGEASATTESVGDRVRPSSRGDRDHSGMLCNYCEKPNHVRRDCRKRLGLCLVCGSADHRVATCPERRSGRMMETSSGRGNYGRHSAGDMGAQDTRNHSEN